MKTPDLSYRKLVLVCVNFREEKACCAGSENEEIFREIKARVKAADPTVRVSKTGCLGNCLSGPVVCIMPDAIWLGEVTMDDVPEIVRLALHGKPDRAFFERETEKALEIIPEKFRDALGNIAVLLEETSDDGLLGLYEGLPVSEYAGDPTGILPPTLTLFMDDIIAEAEERHGGDVSRVIRETVWHEFAHALGFDEDAAHRLEYKWESRWRERYS